jgi:hypothetical protein
MSSTGPSRLTGGNEDTIVIVIGALCRATGDVGNWLNDGHVVNVVGLVGINISLFEVCEYRYEEV